VQPEVRQKIEALFERYPQKRGALLPAIYLVQAENGWVSPEQARELAELFEIPPVQVWEVVQVCTNLSCSLRGARTMLKELEAHLGIPVGGTTEDGRITLGHEECLGSCGTAPVISVDHRYHENLDTAQAKQIVDQLE
jgi:NADH-quinone oxidoreductase subunit E